jgi:hypothetical protein
MIRRHTSDEIADGVAGLYAGMAQGPPPPAPDPARLRRGRSDLETWARAQLRHAPARSPP